MKIQTVRMRTMRALLVALSLTLTASAAAEPWVSTGQTKLADSAGNILETEYGAPGVENPTPNLVGLLGEVALPYQVPADKVLIIKGYGFEAHTYPTQPSAQWLDKKPRFVIFPWISDAPDDVFHWDAKRKTRAALLSCMVTLQTNICHVEYHVPAGRVVNMNILNSDRSMSTHGWIIWGELIDAP